MLILTPASFSLASPGGPSAMVDWARSANGQQLLDHGSSALSALPAESEVVFVLPPQATSWHRINLPKVPASKLRAVLDGLLEERVLNDTAELHFALAPGAKAGQSVWVAACHKAWVQGWIQTLGNAGLSVARIVPGAAPLGADPSTTNNSDNVAEHWAFVQNEQTWLSSAHSGGVYLMPLNASCAATLAALSVGDPSQSSWLAEPAAAGQAEASFERRFELQNLSKWLLRNAQSEWNLAQFDLSLSGSARRGQQAKQSLREWRSAPAWRAARWGLAALVVTQIVGINASAWQERRSLQAKKEAVNGLLKTTFPQVTLILDAPVQMRRELTQMRQTSGQLSTNDLEAMLAGVAQASAAELPALTSVQFQSNGPNGSGQAQLTATENSSPNWPSMQETLRRAGWEATIESNQMTLRAAQP